MNTWPTLKEWTQFSGTLALEAIIVFAIAKLVTLHIRSAQGRRALWQVVLVAMFLLAVGELSGVRAFLRLPDKPKPAAWPQRSLVVTIKEPDASLSLPPLPFPVETPIVLPAPPRLSRWQQHVAWPALAWLAGTTLLLGRALLAQIIALRFRLSCLRIDDEKLNEKLQRIRLAMRPRAASVPPAITNSKSQQGAGGTLKALCRRVVLLESARAIAPFTFGIWKPVIVLPCHFATAFTPDQQDAALAHELAHVAGFDSAWRAAGEFVVAFLWWHPLAWLAKRELAHASELAADESSLLVANGPDRLAECLLACAKELRRPALAGWLGMDGGGFRSALGKRVARLLQLNAQTRLSRPVPWYLRLLAPIICVALLWMGMAAVIKFGEPRGNAWRASILGSAFAAAAESANSKRVARERANLLQELYAQGTTYADSQAAKPSTPTAITTNSAAVSNLSDLPHFGKFFSNEEPNVTRRGLQLEPIVKRSPERQAIYDKLRSTRLSEWGPLDNVPLSEVIRDLADATRRIDPEHQGVNFILSGPSPAPQPAGVEAAGLPIAPTNEPINLNATTIRLGTKLFDVNAEEVLNIVMKIADQKIKFSIEDFGVVISPKGNEPTPLHARFFQMDSNAFQRLLKSTPRAFSFVSPNTRSGRGGLGSGANGTNGVRFLTGDTRATEVIPNLQNWFKSMGVDLADPGKAVFYSDRKGMLMIRATLEDLNVIEKAFQQFGITPRAGVLPGSALTEQTNAPSAGQVAAEKAADMAVQIRIESARLVQDGKLYYETRRLEAARTNLQAALRLEPANQGANYYLDLVQAQLAQVRLRAGQLEQEWTEPVNRKTNRNGTAQIPNTTELQTRFFRVDPNTLEQGLKSISAHDPRGDGKKPVFNPNDTNSVIERVQRLLGAAGVDLSAPGRALLYQDRVGTVMVRATLAELDTVEKAIQLLNMSPPQLEIFVKVMEVPADQASKTMLEFGITNNPAAQTGAPGSTNRPAPALTGILTDEQFRSAIRALEKGGGTDLLSAPTVTTMSGRQAQIKVVDIRYIVTGLGYDTNQTAAPRAASAGMTNMAMPGIGNVVVPLLPVTEPFELGPVVDVIPHVLADGWTIQMTVLPTLKEFLGYEETYQKTWATGGPLAQPEPMPTPQPKFRLRQVATSAMVWDGQTLVIGAGSARNMERVRHANRTITTDYTDKALFFFITPRLIDPAGNPLHSAEDFPLRRRNVPFQKGRQEP
jgi:type II secretory pathway component GspD/PulD (secretin)